MTRSNVGRRIGASIRLDVWPTKSLHSDPARDPLIVDPNWTTPTPRRDRHDSPRWSNTLNYTPPGILRRQRHVQLHTSDAEQRTPSRSTVDIRPTDNHRGRQRGFYFGAFDAPRSTRTPRSAYGRARSTTTVTTTIRVLGHGSRHRRSERTQRFPSAANGTRLCTNRGPLIFQRHRNVTLHDPRFAADSPPESPQRSTVSECQ